MATKITRFFATKEDLIPVIQAVEKQRSLKYILTGLLDSPELVMFTSAVDISTLGTATHESAICGATYLVADSCENIVSHKRPQNAGGVRYEVNQLGNPKTIIFQPGGLFEGKVLLYGRIGTISDDPTAIEIFRLFAASVRKCFRKVKGDYVGPNAEVLWNSGTRLTQAVQSPPEFDLVQ